MSYCEKCQCKSCKAMREALRRADALDTLARIRQIAARQEARKTKPAGDCACCRREDLPCDVSCMY
jgi:hypothetical protein